MLVWLKTALPEHVGKTNRTIGWNNSKIITTNRRYKRDFVVLLMTRQNPNQASFNFRFCLVIKRTTKSREVSKQLIAQDTNTRKSLIAVST